MSNEVNYIATIVGKKTTRYLVAIPHLLLAKARRGIEINKELVALVPHKEHEKVIVDVANPVPLGAMVKKDGICYLCFSFSSVQTNLKQITPIFLTRESEVYFSALLKFVEKYPEIAQKEQKYILKTSRQTEKEICFDFGANKLHK